MDCKVDPDGDTVITLQDVKVQSSSPVNTVEKPASGKQFLVSRKHLMLASRRAARVLGGQFAEATPKEDGRFHWTFEPIFNPKAFELVMKLIHGQTRQLPRKIDFVLLADIAVIVDDLECHDAVWFCAKSWLAHVKGQKIPRVICPDLMRWILISFTFEEPDIFQEATTNAIGHSTSTIPTYDFPIQPMILDDISAKRESVLSDLFGRLSNLETQMRGRTPRCNENCKDVLRIRLDQGLKTNKLSPLPSAPYGSWSISAVLYKLKAWTEEEIQDYYHEKEDCTDELDFEGLWSVRRRLSERKPLSERNPLSRRKQPGWVSRIGEKALPHKCRIDGHLSGPLAIAEASSNEGLELAKYLRV